MGCFSSALACFYSIPAHLCARAGLPPVAAPPSLTDGVHLSGQSSPKSPPVPRPRVIADQIPVIKSATRRVLAPPQCPPVLRPS
jgi:hypothetical protein